MSQKVTVSDIAARVGLSKSAVAKVLLNNRSTIRVGEESARLIRKVAAEMNYRPNTMARALRSGRTGMLGLVLGGLSSPFFSEFAEYAVEFAEANHYRLLVSPVRWGLEREQAALDSLLRTNVDGILLKTGLFAARPELIEQYARCGTPIVASQRPHPQLSTQNEDILSGMRELFAAMATCGIRDLAMALNDGATEQCAAYLTGCDEFRIEPKLFRFQSSDDSSLDRCAAEIMAARIPHLLVCSDHYALKLISRFGRAGLRIPGEIAVASIGGTVASSYCNPPLTVIHENIGRQVEVLMEELFARIGGDETVRHQMVPTRLVPRESFPLPPAETGSLN